MADDGGQGSDRRTGILIGFLSALAIGLAAALVVVLVDDDGEEPSRPATATTATAPTVTTTEPSPTATTVPEPPANATIGQPEAKQAAAEGASRNVRRSGIDIPPGDWDTRCTAVGGRAQAEVWRCQVASSSGQCAGSIVAYAARPGVAATREPDIACGE
jgi:hypothetical protein